MKRLAILIGGLLVLPAFAEVAPVFIEDEGALEYADGMYDENGFLVAPGAEIVDAETETATTETQTPVKISRAPVNATPVANRTTSTRAMPASSGATTASGRGSANGNSSRVVAARTTTSGRTDASRTVASRGTTIDKNDPNIIMGDILLPELGDKVCITIIATGCGNTGYQQVAQAQVAPVQQTYTAPRASDLVNSLGAPAAPAQQAAPVQPQPVAATPRPTSLNFVALAQTVPMPTVEIPSTQQSIFTQHGAQPAGFAAPGFSATAPAEESILGTPNASLPETQEFSAAADVDIMNTDSGNAFAQKDTSLETPTFLRNTIAEKACVTSSVAATPVTNETCALRNSGVNYDVPAFLRGSDVF